MSAWELWAAGVVVTLVGPVVLAVGLTVFRRVGVVRFVRTRFALLAALDPTPTGWDRVFGPREAGFIRAKLSDGFLVGGYFGPRSYASSYPEPQDLFIEQQWWVDADGDFIRPVTGSRGLLIAREDVLSIEMLAATMVGGE